MHHNVTRSRNEKPTSPQQQPIGGNAAAKPGKKARKQPTQNLTAREPPPRQAHTCGDISPLSQRYISLDIASSPGRPSTTTVESHWQLAHARMAPIESFSHGLSRIGIDNQVPILFEVDQKHLLRLVKSFNGVLLDGEQLLARTVSNPSGAQVTSRPTTQDGSPPSILNRSESAIDPTSITLLRGDAGAKVKINVFGNNGALADMATRLMIVNLTAMKRVDPNADPEVEEDQSPLAAKYSANELQSQLCGVPPSSAISMRYRLSPWRTVLEGWILALREERRPDPRSHASTVVPPPNFHAALARVAGQPADPCWQSVRPPQAFSKNVSDVLQMEVFLQCAIKAADLGTVARNLSSTISATGRTGTPLTPGTAGALGFDLTQHAVMNGTNSTASPNSTMPLAGSPRQAAVRAKALMYEKFVVPPRRVPHLISTSAAVYAFVEHLLPNIFGPCAGVVKFAFIELLAAMYHPSARVSDPMIFSAEPLGAVHPSLLALRYTHTTYAHEMTQYSPFLLTAQHRMKEKNMLKSRHDGMLFNMIKTVMKRLIGNLFRQWRTMARRHRSLKAAVAQLFVSTSDGEVLRRGISRWRILSSHKHDRKQPLHSPQASPLAKKVSIAALKNAMSAVSNNRTTPATPYSPLVKLAGESAMNSAAKMSTPDSGVRHSGNLQAGTFIGRLSLAPTSAVLPTGFNSLAAKAPPGLNIWEPRTPAERLRRSQLLYTVVSTQVKHRNAMTADFEYTERCQLEARIQVVDDSIAEYVEIVKKVGESFKTCLDYLFPLIPSPHADNTIDGNQNPNASIVQFASDDGEECAHLKRMDPLDLSAIAKAGKIRRRLEKQLEQNNQGRLLGLPGGFAGKRSQDAKAKDSSEHLKGKSANTSSASLPAQKNGQQGRLGQVEHKGNAFDPLDAHLPSLQDAVEQISSQVKSRQQCIFRWLHRLAKYDVAAAGPSLSAILQKYCGAPNAALTLGVVSRTTHLLPIVRLLLLVLSPPHLKAPLFRELFPEELMLSASTLERLPPVVAGGLPPPKVTESLLSTPAMPLARSSSEGGTTRAFRQSSFAEKKHEMENDDVVLAGDELIADMHAQLPELREEEQRERRKSAVSFAEMSMSNITEKPRQGSGTEIAPGTPEKTTTQFDLEGNSPPKNMLSGRRRSLAAKLQVITLRAAQQDELKQSETFSQRYQRNRSGAADNSALIHRRKSVDLHTKKTPQSIMSLEQAALSVVSEHRKSFMGLRTESMFVLPEALDRNGENSPTEEDIKEAVAEQNELIFREAEVEEIVHGAKECPDGTTLAHLLIKLMNRVLKRETNNNYDDTGNAARMFTTSSLNSVFRVFPKVFARHLVLKGNNWRPLIMAALYYTQVGPTCLTYRNLFTGIEARSAPSEHRTPRNNGGGVTPSPQVTALLPESMPPPVTGASLGEGMNPLAPQHDEGGLPPLPSLNEGATSISMSVPESGEAQAVSKLPPRRRMPAHIANSEVPTHDCAPYCAVAMHQLLRKRRQRKKDLRLDIEEANALTMYNDCVRDISVRAFYGADLSSSAQQVYEQYCAASPDIASATFILPSFLASKLRIVFGPDSSFWKPVTSIRVVKSPKELEDIVTTLAPLARITPEVLCDRMIHALDDSDLFFATLSSPEVEDAYTACLPEISVVFALYSSGDPLHPVVDFQNWMQMNQPLYDLNYSAAMADSIYHIIARRLKNYHVQEQALASGAYSLFQVSQALIGKNHPDPQTALADVGLDLDSFCDALSVLVSMKFPSPFVPLEQKVVPFIETLLVPLVGAKSKDMRRRMYGDVVTKKQLRQAEGTLGPELLEKIRLIKEKKELNKKRGYN